MAKRFEVEVTETRVSGVTIEVPASTPQTAYKTFETTGVSMTLAEVNAERERVRAERRRIDVLERLDKQLGRHGRGFNPDEMNDDLRDAADEIRWLRAGRPEDLVPRAELNEMSKKLREMQALIASMIDRIQPK